METMGFTRICVISGKGNLGGILAPVSPVASVALTALTLTIEREKAIGILDGIVGLDGLYVDEVFVGGEELSFYAKDTEDAWGTTIFKESFTRRDGNMILYVMLEWE